MTKEKSRGNILSKFGTVIALILLCVILAILTPNFLKVSNLMNVLKQTAVNAIIATGMLVCLITGGIDLSVGANAVTVTCLIGLLHTRGVSNVFVLVAAALACGTFIGYINGSLLTKLRLPHPFVSTLGMKNILAGVALLLVNSKMVSGFGPGISWLGSASLFTSGSFPGVPASFLLVIIVFVLMQIFLTKTPLGRSIYSVGGNREAARLSGINSDNVLTFAYTLSGFMCAIAGIILIGRGGIANGANAIQPYDTDAIAACIIGGASFAGGKGDMKGTMIGSLIIAVLRNGLTLLAASGAIQNVVIGSVIILAVYIDVVRERLEAERLRLASK
ncbi:MAG: ABC transporter permease [Clostridiaceae bacterium]|nr:ABC transporter permease [Clostridiaceae bacterium]